MRLKGVLFDFDGTLADTLGDIAASVNHALGEFFGSSSRVTREQCRQVIGRGLRNALKDSLALCGVPFDEESLSKGLEVLEDYYGRHPVDHTRPYGQIGSVLEFCQERGLALGVFSNKAQSILEDVVRRLFPEIGYVCGLRPGLPRKPSPEGLLRFAATLGLPSASEGILYVGDSEVDWETGRAGSVPTLIATWGFRSRARLLETGVPASAMVGSPAELLAAIGRLA